MLVNVKHSRYGEHSIEATNTTTLGEFKSSVAKILRVDVSQVEMDPSWGNDTDTLTDYLTKRTHFRSGELEALGWGRRDNKTLEDLLKDSEYAFQIKVNLATTLSPRQQKVNELFEAFERKKPFELLEKKIWDDFERLHKYREDIRDKAIGDLSWENKTREITVQDITLCFDKCKNATKEILPLLKDDRSTLLIVKDLLKEIANFCIRLLLLPFGKSQQFFTTSLTTTKAVQAVQKAVDELSGEFDKFLAQEARPA